MNNNNEDHIWITTQRRRARGLGATMLSISQMCKPYVLSEIKRKKEKKKKERDMKGICNLEKAANSQYR